LAATVLLQAAAAAWVLAPSGTWVPLAGAFNLSTLPYVIAWTALLGSALLAPLLAGQTKDVRLRAHAGDPRRWLIQAWCGALWQGAVAAFLLMVAARLTPLPGWAVLQTSAWVVLCAGLNLLLARLAPRACAAAMFAWLVALPVCGYLCAEVILSSPSGSAGWQHCTGAARGLLRWALSSSPTTAVMGTLSGALPDGSEGPGVVPPLVIAALAGVLSVLTVRGRKTPAAAAVPRSLLGKVSS
jgi:hypothetical protein